MRKLRLLYLLPAEGFGGAERQGLYHLRELPRHDIEVHAVVGPGQPLLRALAGSSVSHELFAHFPDRTPAAPTPLGRLRYLESWLSSLSRATAAIEQSVRREPFDLIFANRTFAWLVAATLAKRLGLPYAIRAGSRPARPAFALGLPLLDRAARPAAVFSNCEAVDRTIGSHFHARRFLLPNAVDPDEFSPGPSEPARARLGLPPRAPLIGLAARPAPEKGFDLLARVIARVRARRPDACFVVAGEFGLRARYEAELRAAGLGEAARFLGHVDAVSDFFRAVDVVVLTSRSKSIEASPNALLEAMATERPVVATGVGGVPELIDNGVHGYLVGEDDDALFADRILELLSTPDRRAALGRAGRARAVSRHRVSLIVEGFSRDLRAALPSVGPERRGRAISSVVARGV